MAVSFGWVSSGFKDTSKQTVTATSNAEPTADYSDTFCGKWDTKQEALKQLFNWYKKKSRRSIRWYIDLDGKFRYFELGERLGQEIIFQDDERLIDFKVTKDANNIINYMVGHYGEGEEASSVTLSNASSIATYGKCIDDKIQQANFTEQEMLDYMQWQLDQKSEPIYTAVITLAGLYNIEPGKQIRFPDSDKYGDIIFTVVDITMNGDSEGKKQTVLNLSSIDTSIPNEFEIMQSIAESESDKVRSKVGTVVGTSGDRVTVALETGGTINARYVSKI